MHKCSSIVLVEQALLGTFQGTGDQLVSRRILSAPPPSPTAMLGACAVVRHHCVRDNNRRVGNLPVRYYLINLVIYFYKSMSFKQNNITKSEHRTFLPDKNIIFNGQIGSF